MSSRSHCPTTKQLSRSDIKRQRTGFMKSGESRCRASVEEVSHKLKMLSLVRRHLEATVGRAWCWTDRSLGARPGVMGSGAAGGTAHKGLTEGGRSVVASAVPR